MDKKIINSKNAPSPIGPYSQAVLAQNILFGSGQIAIDPKTGLLQQNSIEEEATQVMKNIEAVLKEAEMSFSHIVKTTILLSDMSLFVKVNEVYGSFFKTHPPARETFAVKELPKKANIEISFIAIKQ